MSIDMSMDHSRRSPTWNAPFLGHRHPLSPSWFKLNLLQPLRPGGQVGSRTELEIMFQNRFFWAAAGRSVNVLRRATSESKISRVNSSGLSVVSFVDPQIWSHLKSLKSLKTSLNHYYLSIISIPHLTYKKPVLALLPQSRWLLFLDVRQQWALIF